MNPTAIEHHLGLVLLQWMVIMAAAWFFGRAGQRLGQPLAVGEIFAGIVLGPSLLGLVWPSIHGALFPGQPFFALFPDETQQSLQLLGKLGLILLLFQVGMEFDYGHLASRSRAVLAVSAAGIVAPVAGGLLIGPWLHRNFAPETPFAGFQMFVCIALSITALPIMGRILLEMRLERTALGALGISSAAIDDVVGWVGLAVISALAKSQFEWMPFLGQVAGVLVFFGGLMTLVGPWLCGRWQKSRGFAEGRLGPGFMTVLLTVLFTCCLITNKLGIFSIFGAFLLGVALHQDTSLVKAWREKFADFVLVALVPIFFTNTGLRTEIGSLNTGTAWLGAVVVLVVATAGKFGGCWAAARFTGQPQRESLCVAALMNTRALMALVAINIGFELKLLPRELFTMFVLMALLTTAMTGPMLRAWLPEDLKKLVPRVGG